MANVAFQRHRSWVLGLALLGCATPSCQAAGQTLEISVPEGTGQGTVALAVLEAAYARLDITLNTRVLPLRRGLQLADAGEIDGDVMRTLPSIHEWQRLRAVKVPVARIHFSAYKLAANCPRSVSFAELAAQRVSYRRGVRVVETNLPAQALVASGSNLDVLRQLQRGVTGYAVASPLETDLLITKHGLREICKVAEPVSSMDLYHSLNIRHAQLALRLEKVLAEMERTGETARIIAAESQRVREFHLATPVDP